MAVILSICIPTYNRSECLKECLSSVLASAAGRERDIEIVISDNASTDGTVDVIRAFQNMHPWIRCHRNGQNVGGDRNIYAVAAMGTGEYIWVFGDDDKMEPEAIARVLEQIKSGYGLVICNYSVWDKSFSFKKKNDGLHIGKDRAFEDQNELLKRFNLHLGYISSVVINRAMFFKLTYDEYWTFIDYGFPFMYAVYAGVARKDCRAMYISAPIVCNRSGNSGNYDWCKYIVVGSSLIFDALLDEGYTKYATLHAKHKVFTDFVIPNMIYLKLRDDYDPIRVFGLMFQYYKKDWLFWISCVPVWLIPSFLIRLARNTVRAIRSLVIILMGWRLR